MTIAPQSPSDRIIWILSNSSGKMDRSKLRRCTGMKLADLNLILEELTLEGQISGEIVSITIPPRTLEAIAHLL